MKNNRQLKLTADFFKAHPVPKTSPPPDSLFWKMWHASEDTARQALNTKFIQGINDGTLDPVIYGGFNISDAYYCFHGADDYQKASAQCGDPLLKAFLEKKYNSYQSYNETFPKTWRIKDATGIAPTQACMDYSAFETQIASSEDPVYTLVAMLPCEYLWAWLAAQLAPPASGNLYASWITDNNYPDGAYAMGNFIAEYQKSHPIDEDKALQIYQQAMEFEYRNFQSAFDPN